MIFIPSTVLNITQYCPDNSIIFAFSGNNIIVSTNDIFIISNINGKCISGDFIHLGQINEVNCYAVELPSETVLPKYLTAINFRDYIKELNPDFFAAVARGRGLLNWLDKCRYCGTCGHKLVAQNNDFAQVCNQCGKIFYPKISPAIIVAVLNKNKILLAHNKNFRNGMYSTIAGFVEVGETLENCVRREVLEETGISVRNIRYFGSQPWPFPDAIMLGFIAEYDSGELRPDGNEIIELNWFTADNLPEIPSPGSISRQLIDYFIALSQT
jgi:NAD+ diphosphatase